MADGKQWYNNPNEPAKRKVSGNPARPVNKSGKPVVKASGNRPVDPRTGKPAARPNGSRAEQLPHPETALSRVSTSRVSPLHLIPRLRQNLLPDVP